MVKTLMSLVNPGLGAPRANPCSPASRFRREDLPTLERPMKANSGSDSSGHEFKSGALQSKMADEMFTMENAQSIVAQINGNGTRLTGKRWTGPQAAGFGASVRTQSRMPVSRVPPAMGYAIAPFADLISGCLFGSAQETDFELEFEEAVVALARERAGGEGFEQRTQIGRAHA